MHSFPHDIHAVDSGYLRPQLAAVHLIRQQGHIAIIDPAHNDAFPRIEAALQTLDIPPAAVDFVIATHVHLDHAGGSGRCMAAFPNARLVVHPRGARHLIAPEKLFAGVCEVYGAERARKLYGELVPVAPERVIEAPDDFELDFRGRRLRFIDTPGHARHHFCVWDETACAVFTGDTMGISYREFDVDERQFVFPTTTPSQFEPAALHASLDRLLALQPQVAYLTHYTALHDLPAQVARLHRRIDALADIARRHAGKADCKSLIESEAGDYLLAEAMAHGAKLSRAEMLAVLGDDSDLNAQGLAGWVARN